MSWKFKVLVFFLILFLVWIFAAPFLSKNLIVEKPLKKADAILVLSGSSVYKERTQKAAEVYKQGVAKKILLTDDGGLAGWSQEEQRNPPFVYLAERELIARGVRREDIEILKPQVSGTIYEARALRDRIEKGDLSSVLIVTSAYHTKRSLWTFRKVLPNDIEIGIVSSLESEQVSTVFWWLSPKDLATVVEENMKFFVYWVYY